MRSPNYALRKGYVARLAGITLNSESVEVFYQYVPDTYTGKYYIILNNVSNNDVSTMSTSDTQTSMSVGIYTREEKYNSGKAADDITDIVMQRIYPNKQTNLDLSADGFQITNTRLAADNTNNWTMEGQQSYIDRTLIFIHTIFHKTV